jgi:hypothetical protein
MSGLMEGIQHGLGSCDVTDQVGGDELVDGGKWVGNVDLQQEQKDETKLCFCKNNKRRIIIRKTDDNDGVSKFRGLA